MRVAIAWNGPNSRTLHPLGTKNQEGMSASVVRKVADALEEAGHDTSVVEGDIGLLDRLSDLEPTDPVFNLCYGIQGASRYTHVPGLLEMAGYRYTGSDPVGHAVALEKPVAKAMFQSRGLPTPDSYIASPGAHVDVKLPFPVVVKPVRESTSLGIRLVEDRESLEDAVSNIHDKFGEAALVERFVPGLDIFVPVLGNEEREVLPIVQVEAAEPLLTHADKEANEPDLDIRCPAPLGDGIRARIERISKAACDAVGCRDWARVDLRMTPDGDVQLLEVNTIPGLGRLASLPIAAKTAGIDFDELVLRILGHAIERYEPRRVEATR